MALQERPQDGELNDSLSSGEPNDRGNSKRICAPSSRPFWRVWERSKNLFCSSVFLKASAVAVGLWNPKKSFRSVMIAFVFLLDLFYLLYAVYYNFVCRRFDTPLNSWFCGNSPSNLSSLRLSSPEEALQGIQLHVVLSIIGNFAVLSSHVAFFWCMWKLRKRSKYCMTLDKAYSAAKRSDWVTLNCTMLFFGILLLIFLFWLNLSLEEKYSLAYRVELSLRIMPLWVTLTSSWLFALITNAMKDCVSRCHAEIRNAAHCSTDDIIRIHKRLCQQLSSTSEALKIWFVVHWFLLAIVEVIFVAEMVSLFKHAPNWFLFYQCVLWSLIFLYVFVYPSYCASSVTVRCNKILKDLNMTTGDEWQTGHPLYSRSQLALFLQYAQFTNCGFQVGHLTFGSSFAWLSALIAVCSLLLK
ncbi:uncharacterized protein LOC122953823 [Acropora millepora]|uniref:uncharacterized protein LOC122953823 n=1 Tax=Acropora millepora TaxID=45264 RepID=UPI001CF54FF4|nr:uncharacterized protein LOC122953823 [Acropora millepora]